MSIKEWFEKFENIQSKLLEYIESEANVEEKYENFISAINDVCKNKEELKLFLHLLLKISNNHFHTSNFFQKIDKILLTIKDDIKKNFSNFEIFHIFKSNKRILLFLIKNELFSFDQITAKMIIKGKYENRYYPQYFYPEIENFIKDEKNVQKCSELPENYEEKRLIGENNNPICELIRKDSIDEFISCAKQTNMSLKGDINTSIYDTNTFLLGRNITLIQYAAFFGATQIFKYLFMNGAELSVSLWNFAVHSDNSEIIHFIEENKDKIKEKSFFSIQVAQITQNHYINFLKESIKCHHNDVANYILNNFLGKERSSLDSLILLTSLQSYNFAFINEDLINLSIFFELCKFDYIPIVEMFLKYKNVDVNAKYLIIN